MVALCRWPASRHREEYPATKGDAHNLISMRHSSPGLCFSLATLSALLPLAAAAQQQQVVAESVTPPSFTPLARLLFGVAEGKPTGMTGVTRLTSPGAVDSALGSACRELTRAGPFPLDTATRLDGCHTGTAKRVIFRLNLVTFDATREGTTAFMTSARPALVRGICRNPDVPVLGRLGLTLVFQYTGIGNRPVGEVAIAPGSCDT
ncbi:hypothetical protein CURE108131_13110 [Cupriavidus respiraculi]|uniref:Uncharacterized protein n=2 Tax=Cupriavidus respiraculi TaxID=195930 RepID=A0ABN7Z6M0_9BURK|nr:hypothetical protein LMG21510_03942 [Cupriavidus respiraculi]